MESVSNTPAEASATIDCDGNTDTFEKVKSKRSHKRKRDAAEVDMQTEETVAAKRPQFPALSGDQLTVTYRSCPALCVQRYILSTILNDGNNTEICLH